MRILMSAIVAALLVGCSSRSGPSTSSASLVMHDAKGELISHALPDTTASILKSIVTRKPDEDVPGPMPLEAVYCIDLDGHRYALEENELIELLGVRTITWKSEGIQAKILKAAKVR
jgi:hypothetical protein